MADRDLIEAGFREEQIDMLKNEPLTLSRILKAVPRSCRLCLGGETETREEAYPSCGGPITSGALVRNFVTCRMMVGYWSTDMIDSFEIKALAYQYDDDPEDNEHNHQEVVQMSEFLAASFGNSKFMILAYRIL